MIVRFEATIRYIYLMIMDDLQYFFPFGSKLNGQGTWKIFYGFGEGGFENLKEQAYSYDNQPMRNHVLWKLIWKKYHKHLITVKLIAWFFYILQGWSVSKKNGSYHYRVVENQFQNWSLGHAVFSIFDACSGKVITFLQILMTRNERYIHSQWEEETYAQAWCFITKWWRSYSIRLTNCQIRRISSI